MTSLFGADIVGLVYVYTNATWLHCNQCNWGYLVYDSIIKAECWTKVLPHSWQSGWATDGLSKRPSTVSSRDWIADANCIIEKLSGKTDCLRQLSKCPLSRLPSTIELGGLVNLKIIETTLQIFLVCKIGNLPLENSQYFNWQEILYLYLMKLDLNIKLVSTLGYLDL